MDTNPFDKSSTTRELYDYVRERLRELGPIVEETKKTSTHIVAGKRAFLGVHPRASGLLHNIVLDRRLTSHRVTKCEEVSSARYHNEVPVCSEEDLDEELVGWIGEAYLLKVGGDTQRVRSARWQKRLRAHVSQYHVLR